MTKSRKKTSRFPWNDTLNDLDAREFGRGNLAAAPAGNRELGVEVECEGENLPPTAPAGWTVHQDGSLRRQRPNDVAYEYVFRQPETRNDTYTMLDRLDDAFTNADVHLYEESPRTSVHVHVNQIGLTVKQICNQVTLYVCLEELLSEYCGKHRMGNLFCLRACDSDHIIETLTTALRDDRWARVADEHMRYAGLNLASLFKFGTLEYRSMRCTRDFTAIKKWVDILCRLKDKALEFENPQAIIEAVSVRGPAQFVVDVLGHTHGAMVMASSDYHKRLFDGMRIAQDLAYAVSWEPNGDKLSTGWTGAEVNDEPMPAWEQPLRVPTPRLRVPTRAINMLNNIPVLRNMDMIDDPENGDF